MNNQIDKYSLHQHCKSILEHRISDLQHAMEDAQNSANSEEKSSAGDKYETGRAMSQIARDMSAKQLHTAKSDYQELLNTPLSLNPSHVQKGALVLLSNQQFIFLCIALGVISYNHQKVAVVSIKSPIAMQLTGKKIGDVVNIANQSLHIIDCY